MGETFRETMWFKLGNAPAPEAEDGDEEEPSATVMMLPVEDRYGGGGVTAEDTAQFGLHTGTTMAVRVISPVGEDDDVSMHVLAREMKQLTRAFAIGAGALILCAAFALYII